MGEAKRKKERAKPFPEKAYMDIPLSDLVLYAVFSLETKKVETTFENIVAECFELFPKKFSLHGYPEYPDANRVRREIQRLEGTLSSPGIEKLVDGNMKTSYRITEKGLKKLKEIQMRLRYSDFDAKIRNRIKDRRGKITRVIHEVEKHPLYKNYLKKGEYTQVPEGLLRDLLFATMDTSNEELRENLEKLKEYCDILGREDIKKFLEFCASKHTNIFGDKARE